MAELDNIESAALAERTIWDGLQIYAHAPGTSMLETAHVRAICTGVGHEGFNAAAGVGCTPVEEIDRALTLFREAGTRMLWHMWPHNREIEHALLRHGLVFYEEEPAMVADLRAVTAPSASAAGVEIRLATTAEDLKTWVRVLTGSSTDTFIKHVAELRTATNERTGAHFQHLLGFVDGRAVATAGVFHGREAAEIQHIATEQSHRRRGIGTAITAAALDLARQEGRRYGVLTASPDGEKIYERLGFQTVATVRRFFAAP